MYIFIDESGIQRQNGQSTTALVYIKVENLENLDKAIIQEEKNLRIKPFHWSEQSWKIKSAFLEAVLPQDFEVKIFVFLNPFTQEKLENALKHMLVEKRITKIVIDGEKPRSNVLRLKKVLRDSGVSVKKIRMGNDNAFPCLRLADLFAGLTRAYFNDKSSEKTKKLYNLAKIKITTLAGGQAFG
jgi:hypothetical protein